MTIFWELRIKVCIKISLDHIVVSAWCSGCCGTSLVYVLHLPIWLNLPLPTCTLLGCAFITFVRAVMMKTINTLCPRGDKVIDSWLFIKHNKKRDVFSPAQVFDCHSLCHTVSLGDLTPVRTLRTSQLGSCYGKYIGLSPRHCTTLKGFNAAAEKTAISAACPLQATLNF